MAVELFARAPDSETAACEATVDFGSMILAREVRVPRDAQVKAVRCAKDEHAVWKYVSAQSDERARAQQAKLSSAQAAQEANALLEDFRTEEVDGAVLQEAGDTVCEEGSAIPTADICEPSSAKKSKKEESSAVRRGAARDIQPKKRHDYRGDALRPKLGYKCGVRTRAGVAALHQPDASRAVRVNHKRVSRITRVAGLRLKELARRARQKERVSKDDAQAVAQGSDGKTGAAMRKA